MAAAMEQPVLQSTGFGRIYAGQRFRDAGSSRMCGKFTQMSSWQEVDAFSQPLVVKSG